MSDIYLDDQGNVERHEGTTDGKSALIFKPIAFFGPITIFEEHSVDVVASPPAVSPT